MPRTRGAPGQRPRPLERARHCLQVVEHRFGSFEPAAQRIYLSQVVVRVDRRRFPAGVRREALDDVLEVVGGGIELTEREGHIAEHVGGHDPMELEPAGDGRVGVGPRLVQAPEQ